MESANETEPDRAKEEQEKQAGAERRRLKALVRRRRVGSLKAVNLVRVISISHSHGSQQMKTIVCYCDVYIVKFQFELFRAMKFQLFTKVRLLKALNMR